MTIKDRAHKAAITIASYGLSRGCTVEGLTEIVGQAITAAVAKEREACANIVYKQYIAYQEGERPASALVSAESQIRARSTVSSHSIQPAETATDAEAP